MQAGRPDETPTQRIQRDRFRYVVQKYSLLSNTDRVRWVDANPEYHSFLYGYNFFMLEGLMGAGPTEYPQMIKSIQVVKVSMAIGGNTNFAINTVDPLKCVVLIAGNSQKYANVQRGSSTIADGGSNNHALSPNVNPDICEVLINGQAGALEISGGDGQGDWAAPYASALAVAQLTVAMVATGSTFTSGYSWQVIEHVEATVYPVLVSIAAELVVMAWAIPPSIAADITITVVEYL